MKKVYSLIRYIWLPTENKIKGIFDEIRKEAIVRERERCAKIADSFYDQYSHEYDLSREPIDCAKVDASEEIATAIRKN